MEKIIFILFDTYSNNIWYLGKIFLKKYQLYFNNDTKMIGFYNYYNDNIVFINEYNNKILLFLILLGIIFLVAFYALKKGIGKIFGKKIKSNEIELELNKEEK